RAVRMPEAVAEGEQPAAVLARQRLSAPGPGGHVDHALFQAGLVVPCGVVPLWGPHLSRNSWGSHLVVIADAPVARNTHSVAIHPSIDGRDVFLRHRRPQVQAGSLARERGA